MCLITSTICFSQQYAVVTDAGIMLKRDNDRFKCRFGGAAANQNRPCREILAKGNQMFEMMFVDPCATVTRWRESYSGLLVGPRLLTRVEVLVEVWSSPVEGEGLRCFGVCIQAATESDGI